MDQNIEKQYNNGELTVVWQPHKCTHSTICFKGLPEVFDPTLRPWVDIYGASTDEIVSQVKQCPSGALSYLLNDQPPELPEEKQPDAPGVSIDLMPDGPMIIRGSFTLRYTDGTVANFNNVNTLCRCGHSARSPFCDGSHYDKGFKD